MTTGEEAGGGELAGVGEAEGVGIDPRRRLLVLGGDGGEEGIPSGGEEEEGGPGGGGAAGLLNWCGRPSASEVGLNLTAPLLRQRTPLVPGRGSNRY